MGRYSRVISFNLFCLPFVSFGKLAMHHRERLFLLLALLALLLVGYVVAPGQGEVTLRLVIVNGSWAHLPVLCSL